MHDEQDITVFKCPVCGEPVFDIEVAESCPWCLAPLDAAPQTEQPVKEKTFADTNQDGLKNNVFVDSEVTASGDIVGNVAKDTKITSSAHTGTDTETEKKTPKLATPFPVEIERQGCLAVVCWNPVDRIERHGHNSVNIGKNVFKDVNITIIQAADKQLEYEVWRFEEDDDIELPLHSTEKLRKRDEDVECGIRYYYQVRAVQGTQRSEWSEKQEFIFQPRIFGKPVLKEEGVGTVRVEIKKPKKLNCRIERKGPDDRDFGEVKTITRNITNPVFSDKDITKSGIYQYRLRCVCEKTEGDQSEVAEIFVQLPDPNVRYEYRFRLVCDDKKYTLLTVIAAPSLRVGRENETPWTSERDDKLFNHINVTGNMKYSRDQAEIMVTDAACKVDQGDSSPARLNGRLMDLEEVIRDGDRMKFDAGDDAGETYLDFSLRKDDDKRPWLLSRFQSGNDNVQTILFMPGMISVDPREIATDDCYEDNKVWIFRYDPAFEEFRINIQGRDFQIRENIRLHCGEITWRVKDFERVKCVRAGVTPFGKSEWRCLL